MKSYLQELENNEAILLMYLANELPAQDRVEVDQMLASDPSLRSELEILRQTQDLAFDALRSLDAVTRPAMMPITAQRRIGEMIRRWLSRRYQRAHVIPMAARQLPWRRIGMAAAASLMIGYYIYAVYHQKFGLDDNVPNSGMQGPGYVSRGEESYPEDWPQLPPHRDLSQQEKLALLAIPMDDSNSDESNLHVAEVAAVTPADADYSGDSKPNSDINANSTGAP